MDFHAFAQAHGLIIDSLRPSSRIQRCATEESPRSKNGAYLYEGDRGWVQRWDGDGDVHWWDDPDRAEPTQAERDDWARRRADREVEQERLWGGTSRKAKELRLRCTLKEHNYLHRKGLGDVKGLVTPDDDLFVGMTNYKSEKLVGFQTIHWDSDERVWVKKMAYGSRLRESVLRLGPAKASEVCLCEGYATGLSIDKALRQMRLNATILVCFNDSNMVSVSKLLPPMRKYVFADNDASGAGERAAQATGLSYCMSPEAGEDANDLHVRAGVFSVMDLLHEARKIRA